MLSVSKHPPDAARPGYELTRQHGLTVPGPKQAAASLTEKYGAYLR